MSTAYKTITIVLMLAMLTGCNKLLQSSLTSSEKSLQRDSVHAEVRLRVDTVVIPGDSVLIQVPVQVKCPDNEQPIFFAQEVQTGSKRTAVKVKVTSNGDLVVDAYCKELEQSVYHLDSINNTFKQTIDSLQTYQRDVVQVRVIPGAYKWAMGFTVSFFILLILFLAYKIFKLTPYGKFIPF